MEAVRVPDLPSNEHVHFSWIRRAAFAPRLSDETRMSIFLIGPSSGHALSMPQGMDIVGCAQSWGLEMDMSIGSGAKN